MLSLDPDEIDLLDDYELELEELTESSSMAKVAYFTSFIFGCLKPYLLDSISKESLLSNSSNIFSFRSRYCCWWKITFRFDFDFVRRGRDWPIAPICFVCKYLLEIFFYFFISSSCGLFIYWRLIISFKSLFYKRSLIHFFLICLF